MKAYSTDLRQRVVAAYDAREGTQEQVAARFSVSLSCVRKLLRQRRATGSIDPKPHGGGHAPAFDNAMILDMAMGGSTNTVLHILAIAGEAEVPFTMKRIDELSQKTPNICKVSPSSSYHIEDVARAGGIHAILGEVARGCPGLLDLTCSTVTGKTLGENIAEHDVRGAFASAGAQLLTRVRPGGVRTTQALTVPSVAADSRSQAAGLAVLDSEG